MTELSKYMENYYFLNKIKYNYLKSWSEETAYIQNWHSKHMRRFDFWNEKNDWRFRKKQLLYLGYCFMLLF